MIYGKEKQDNIIKKSHERSVYFGIEENRVFPKKILKGKEITNNIEKNKSFLKVASPFIDILYDFLKGSEFFIILTDKEGCILKIIGDKEVMDIANNLNMVVGAFMSENSIGTNAMGTAIKEDIPIQISEREHFIKAYHRWTCSAAPIHDINGDIIGCLNLTGDRDRVHSHTLGLVVAAVKSIENQINVDNTNKKLLETYQYMNTIVDSISSGIYVVDFRGKIKTINKAACNILGIEDKDVLDKNVENILPNWHHIFERIKNGKPYEDKEAVLNDKLIKGRYNVSATPIQIENKIIGMVIVFKEIKTVLDLVNKYSGMRAVYNFEDIIGESKEIKKVINYAKSISSSPSTVLIEGESGTGKELLAQSIHNYGDRRENSFIALNCGAIPKSLIESELFGYEDGAFTGARRGGHAGKFELANGGTLFLDEIGEMPLDMQVSLLRVLQEGYVTRVGGDKVIPVDVRIIAATNKDLKKEVEKGTFRQDLYYRLSVIPIKLPPIRERKGDLPILIKYFFRIKSIKLNKPMPHIKEDIYHNMLQYNWPGNIRELENFIENIVNLRGDSSFMLEEDFKNIEDKHNFHENNIGLLYSNKIRTLEEIEKEAIINTVNEYNRNMSQSAKALGITRATLYSKLKKYNI
ncbi:sigma-54-dependent Fis family transcriptional regulator [Clostridium botulinum]|uniref:Sensory box sigma-54 dependent transcriptional regulator n=1 Tax=Clostridium botulinum (strain Langeland / NCTC 10281 / Type F) TaxID=441772 RepID=A7GDW9_CLOBL|nr:sigma-54-dependent Fis family transcriptional regulator [Clostridium botulinum]ABS39650.1 sensory box sigma-54 dependent transcriptional regulator [Clostridium botulinum F str. Langeland]ADF99415.1 sensory box sigma-54 dependent transcriptional regulator [Clostridium botulinum F str. 230613]KKM43015.1 ATPase AAA [Clostridium botulinum]MBY6791471.1 sigma-54-dependent Fis family transcriptional regulator [Clostridium botulinum]MBY6936703.1 sigma-54-dependent Fis family transcriptional regulat